MMSQYQIVCTEQTGCTASGHIIAVGVGDDAAAASDRMTVREVWNSMDRGNGFYTYGGGEVALVEKYRCSCGQGTLRSHPDHTTANNLDSLRMCRWKA